MDSKFAYYLLCCNAFIFLIVSSDKRKTSAASTALRYLLVLFNTDVETGFGGKEIEKLSVLEKIECL